MRASSGHIRLKARADQRGLSFNPGQALRHEPGLLGTEAIGLLGRNKPDKPVPIAAGPREAEMQPPGSALNSRAD